MPATTITSPITLQLPEANTVAEGQKYDAAQSRIVYLTRGLAAGDEAAFRAFQTLYFDRLYRFLLVVSRGDETQAREALQETLLRVARHARAFADEEIFWGWLVAVGRSAARDAGRKRSRYSALLARFTRRAEADIAPVPPDNLMSEVLTESVEALGADERQLIEGKYIDGQSVKELASQSGLTEKAVESRLLRLRRQLRENILKKLKAP